MSLKPGICHPLGTPQLGGAGFTGFTVQQAPGSRARKDSSPPIAVGSLSGRTQPTRGQAAQALTPYLLIAVNVTHGGVSLHAHRQQGRGDCPRFCMRIHMSGYQGKAVTARQAWKDLGGGRWGRWRQVECDCHSLEAWGDIC